MTKELIIKQLSKKYGISIQDTERIITSQWEFVASVIRADKQEGILLPFLGKIYVKPNRYGAIQNKKRQRLEFWKQAAEKIADEATTETERESIYATLRRRKMPTDFTVSYDGTATFCTRFANKDVRSKEQSNSDTDSENRINNTSDQPQRIEDLEGISREDSTRS